MILPMRFRYLSDLRTKRLVCVGYFDPKFVNHMVRAVVSMFVEGYHSAIDLVKYN